MTLYEQGIGGWDYECSGVLSSCLLPTFLAVDFSMLLPEAGLLAGMSGYHVFPALSDDAGHQFDATGPPSAGGRITRQQSSA